MSSVSNLELNLHSRFTDSFAQASTDSKICLIQQTQMSLETAEETNKPNKEAEEQSSNWELTASIISIISPNHAEFQIPLSSLVIRKQEQEI